MKPSTSLRLLTFIFAIASSSSSTVSLLTFNSTTCTLNDSEDPYCFPLGSCLTVPSGIPAVNKIGNGFPVFAKFEYNAARLDMGIYLDASCEFDILLMSDECGMGICCEPETVMFGKEVRSTAPFHLKYFVKECSVSSSLGTDDGKSSTVADGKISMPTSLQNYIQDMLGPALLTIGRDTERYQARTDWVCGYAIVLMLVIIMITVSLLRLNSAVKANYVNISSTYEDSQMWSFFQQKSQPPSISLSSYKAFQEGC